MRPKGNIVKLSRRERRDLGLPRSQRKLAKSVLAATWSEANTLAQVRSRADEAQVRTYESDLSEAEDMKRWGDEWHQDRTQQQIARLEAMKPVIDRILDETL